MNRTFRRLFAVLLIAVLLVSAASAADSEATISCSWVEITSNEFVADVFCGVEARYNLSGSTYFCSELVTRFYREVYGLSVTTSDGVMTVNGSDSLYFVHTDTPAPGDIAYASPEARGSSYNHYALVKFAEPAAGTVTLFEQNWGWQGKAGVNRVIPYDGGCYEFFTLVGGKEDVRAYVAAEGEAARQQLSGGSAVSTPAPLSAVSGASAQQEQPAQQEPLGLFVGTVEPWLPDAATGTPSAWAQSYVETAKRLGILSGVEGNYREAINRTALARLAANTARALGIVRAVGDPIETVQSIRVMLPDLDGTFDRTSLVTRQMAATVLFRLERLCGDTTQADETFLARYADRRDIADWATEAAAVMTQRGLIKGTEKGFEPRSNMTLEQAVTLLVRICGEG